MARGDVEQRIVGQHEIRLHDAQRRTQSRVDVDFGFARRGRGARARGDQQQGERQPGRLPAPAAALLLGLWLAGCAATAPAPPVASAPGALDGSTPLTSDVACPRIQYILIRKREHQLVARCESGTMIVMTVAIGRDPIGTKQAHGDQRTPEGNYRVSGSARHSRFHRLIPIDYPSRRDADAALARGTLTVSEHARIVAAHAQTRTPPQDTALGGHLGLHGEGREWRGESAGLDWTYGCVAVRDHEIEFLARRVSRGTSVWILP